MKLIRRFEMSNFIQDCINGDALMSDIDNYIEDWHTGDSIIPLHEFLGMNSEEYSHFVQDESNLAKIIANRIENERLAEV